MSLNNWLCRNFDSEKKGHVTPLDIINKVLHILVNEYTIIGSIVVVLIPFCVGGLILTLMHPETNGKTLGYILSTTPILSYPKAWILGIAVYGVCFLIYKILTIRIAKCPLKEDGEDKN